MRQQLTEKKRPPGGVWLRARRVVNLRSFAALICDFLGSAQLARPPPIVNFSCPHQVDFQNRKIVRFAKSLESSCVSKRIMTFRFRKVETFDTQDSDFGDDINSPSEFLFFSREIP